MAPSNLKTSLYKWEKGGGGTVRTRKWKGGQLKPEPLPRTKPANPIVVCSDFRSNFTHHVPPSERTRRRWQYSSRRGSLDAGVDGPRVLLCESCLDLGSVRSPVRVDWCELRPDGSTRVGFGRLGVVWVATYPLLLTTKRNLTEYYVFNDCLFY